MKRSEYNSHRKHILASFKAAVEAATKERDEALRGLESIWQSYHPRTSERAMAAYGAASAAPPATSGSSGYGSLVQSVREAVGTMSADFRRADIVRALETIAPNVVLVAQASSISGCLGRLCKAGEIIEVQHGRGSVPTLYRKAEEIQNEGDSQTA